MKVTRGDSQESTRRFSLASETVHYCSPTMTRGSLVRFIHYAQSASDVGQSIEWPEGRAERTSAPKPTSDVVRPRSAEGAPPARCSDSSCAAATLVRRPSRCRKYIAPTAQTEALTKASGRSRSRAKPLAAPTAVSASGVRSSNNDMP